VRQSIFVLVATQHTVVPDRDSTPLLNVRLFVSSGLGNN